MRVTVLGSSSHVPGSTRDTTSLLVHPEVGSPVLIEAPGGVVHKLRRHGVDPRTLEHVILTHDHTDHIYGFPHLVHALLSHPGPLHVHAPPATVETARRLIDVLGLTGELYPELVFHAVDPDGDAGAAFLEHAGLAVRRTRSEHPRPTLATRFDDARGASFVHSSDTRPTERITELARGAHTLVHDCAAPHRLFDRFGSHHTTAREAAQVATAAGVERLVLIHIYSDAGFDDDELAREARAHFDGEVQVARDDDALSFTTA